MNNDHWKTVARWCLALAAFAFLMYWSIFLASLVGWSLEPRGPHRITERWHVLTWSVLTGLFAVASAQVLLRRRVLTPWLLVALVPAGYFGLTESGSLAAAINP